MIAYIPTSIAIGANQGELPLVLREKLRRFWSIWQESYSDETEENRRDALSRALELPIAEIFHTENRPRQ